MAEMVQRVTWNMTFEDSPIHLCHLVKRQLFQNMLTVNFFCESSNIQLALDVLQALMFRLHYYCLSGM